MDPLAVPRGLQAFLFAGVIGWELLGEVLFWAAFAVFRNRPLGQEPLVVAACAVNLALWCAFQVLDEVFLAYEPEGVHRSLFANQLLTLIALWMLPTEQEAEKGEVATIHSSKPSRRASLRAVNQRMEAKGRE